jgi:hypothetical protein
MSECRTGLAPPRLRRHEHGEHLLLLGEARALRDRPRDDLLAAEVVHGREVGLAEGALEPGDVGAHLLPGAVGGEVAAERVLEGLADLPPVGAVPVVVGLPADAAPEAHLVIILSTVLPAIRAPSTARSSMATCRCPTPFGSPPKISATLARSSGLVGVLGWDSA